QARRLSLERLSPGESATLGLDLENPIDQHKTHRSPSNATPRASPTCHPMRPKKPAPAGGTLWIGQFSRLPRNSSRGRRPQALRTCNRFARIVNIPPIRLKQPIRLTSRPQPLRVRFARRRERTATRGVASSRPAIRGGVADRILGG